MKTKTKKQKIPLGKEINDFFKRKSGPMKHRKDKRKNNKNNFKDEIE